MAQKSEQCLPNVSREELEENANERMISFWEEYRSYISAAGISLFELRIVCENSISERWYPPPSKFRFGQDLAGHDVCIKLTAKGSAEHQINRYLLEKSQLTKDPTFPCLLTGLSYLHEHRIAHRDIGEKNILVNAHCPELEEHESRILVKHHINVPDVAFCFFDYDHAIQLSPNVSLKNARRPAREGNQGSLDYHPPDISLAEPEYNPFAFDIACLGNMFLYHFINAIPIVPPLAPLFSRMTTHVIEKRFTAIEALSFFGDHLSRLPDEVLVQSVTPSVGFEPLCDPHVYWSLLDSQDRQRWKEYYQIPPRTLGQQVLGWITEFDWRWKFLRAIRLMFHI